MQISSLLTQTETLYIVLAMSLMLNLMLMLWMAASSLLRCLRRQKYRLRRILWRMDPLRPFRILLQMFRR